MCESGDRFEDGVETKTALGGCETATVLVTQERSFVLLLSRLRSAEIKN